MSSLDKNTMYLTNVCFGPTDIPEWKRQQFPEVSYEEYQFIKENTHQVENCCFQYFTNSQSIKYEANTVSDVNLVPVTYEFVAIQRLEVQYGRFFTESESNSGTAVIVLGYEIAQGLFENSDPLGKTVRLFGKRFQVIGVTKKKGQNFSMGDSDDTSVFISSNFIRREFGEHNDTMLPVIVVKPEKGADMAEIKAEISYKLRNFRGVKSDEIDNFFLNVLSGFTDFIDNIVGQLNMVGWIISGFSLLVGGFGIANIMFVSVKERTNLIGIQKSLGAKNKFILFQFLFEAIILAVIGGLIGLFLVWIIALTLTNMLDFEFILSFSNVLLGTSLSAIIGLLSGILPAISAARLDPVEAIRTGI